MAVKVAGPNAGVSPVLRQRLPCSVALASKAKPALGAKSKHSSPALPPTVAVPLDLPKGATSIAPLSDVKADTFATEATDSLQRQEAIEAADAISLDEYLDQYFRPC